MSFDQEAFRRLVRGEQQGFGPATGRAALRLLSLPYAAATAVRNLAYDRRWAAIDRVNVPVVSVGNLTVGGTGKTPIVEWTARRLRAAGRRVVLLSRGYGATDAPNDELLLLEENLPDVPHLQGRDRVQLAKIAVEELEGEALILDDGMQHRRLGRDFEIVLVDATDPFGGGWQLPGGLLRESLRGLQRADVVLLTRADAVASDQRKRLADLLRRKAPQALLAEASFRPSRLIQDGAPSQPIEWLRGRRVVGFCGIGNPNGFWKTLESAGAKIIDRRVFADHHAYSRDDVAALAHWIGKLNPDAVATTQKDLVKLRLPEIAGAPLFAVRIEATLHDQEEAVAQRLLDATKPRA